MYKFLTYVFTVLGILILGLTFTFKSELFSNYSFLTSSGNLIIELTPKTFRIILFLYFLMIAAISFRHHKMRTVISRFEMVISILLLAFPIYFYTISIHNAMTAGSIWSTIFPIYNYPQAYVDIINHYFRVINILFCFNIIFLVYYIIKSRQISITKTK